MRLKFPRALVPGDRIAITAISSGVPLAMQPRLDLALENLRSQEFEIVEGVHLRCQHKAASAGALVRAREFEHFLLDDSIAAVFPPWGGELATTILDHLDWAALSAAKPKWVMGFSDISTVQVPLLMRSGWVSLHAANLMQRVPGQTDAVTAAGFDLLRNAERVGGVIQRSSARFERLSPDIARAPDAPFALTEPTEWKCLNRSASSLRLNGRLFGGCLDSLCSLVGTIYAPLPDFVARCGEDGAILFLENAELSPPAMVRTLICLRRNGWFDHLNGVVLGRSPEDTACDSDALSYLDALKMALGDLPCPVLYDADIGHMAPQLALMQGAIATIDFAQGAAVVTQQWG